MSNYVGNRVQAVVKKAKKKQGKDEMDRIKQAEKKRRRLEKALATSAAIRTELEKKKQRKKEEQQRLDEEGAAVAEAVALHVLHGEDSDESCSNVFSKISCFDACNHSSHDNFFLSGKGLSSAFEDESRCLFETVGWVSDIHGTRFNWGSFADDCTLSPRNFGGYSGEPNIEYASWATPEVSAGLLAALQISEDVQVESFP